MKQKSYTDCSKNILTERVHRANENRDTLLDEASGVMEVFCFVFHVSL